MKTESAHTEQMLITFLLVMRYQQISDMKYLYRNLTTESTYPPNFPSHNFNFSQSNDSVSFHFINTKMKLIMLNVDSGDDEE